MFATSATVFGITLLLYTVAMWIFPRLGLLDFPERYGIARARLPYPTGIVSALMALGTLSIILPDSLQCSGVLMGLGIIALCSAIDDRTPLSPLLRLTVHIGALGIIAATGSRIYTVTHPFGGFFKLDAWLVMLPIVGPTPVLAVIVTLAWLMMTTHALNWFDGVEGQVSLVATIGFGLLGYLSAYRSGQMDLARAAFCLSAIAAAGIPFSFPPARMILGDTGAMTYGLLLGLLGVYQGGKVATAFLALGIPLADALFVVTARMIKRQSPLRGGRDHLHHLMQDAGWSKQSIVILTTGISALFGAIALFLSTAEKVIAVILLILLVGTLRWQLRRHRSTQ